MKIQDAINEARASDGRTAMRRSGRMFQIRFRGVRGELADERHWGNLSREPREGCSRWRPFLGFHPDDVMADDWTVESVVDDEQELR